MWILEEVLERDFLKKVVNIAGCKPVITFADDGMYVYNTNKVLVCKIMAGTIIRSLSK